MASAAFTHHAAPAAAGLQTFSSDGDRKRLTGAAVKAVLRLEAPRCLACPRAHGTALRPANGTAP